MRRKKLVQNLVVSILFIFILVFGILPILNRDDSFYDKFEGVDTDSYDVVVLGMEPEGLAAALAASRTGMKVLLVTAEPDPSSYLTDCLIQYMPHQAVRIQEEILSSTGPVFAQFFGNTESTFSSSDWLRGVHAMLLQESGLEMTFDSTLTEVKKAGNKVEALVMYTPKGMRTVKGKVFVDATEKGILLERLGAAFFSGSEDVGAPGFFEPVSFHFRIRGVNWEDIKTIAKVNDLSEEFSDALFLYPRTRDDVKLLNPSLVRQDEDALVVSGLRIGFVDPGDPAAVEAAWQNGLREAMHLTAYLQTELVPFADAQWDVPSARLFIPEHKHYLGVETLTVKDILTNRDRPDKVAVLSDPVTANRFLRGDDPAILCAPNAYAVPIGSLVPLGWNNVLMPGRNASYASLASTSATTPSARVVVGEGAGLAAAWCVLENTDPAAVPGLSSERLEEFVSFLERAGQKLPDFVEPVLQPDGTRLSDAWMAEDVVELVSLGVLMGGVTNDFRLNERCSGEVLTVLAKNALLRLSPEQYSLELDARLAPLATEEMLTVDGASQILLTLADVAVEPGMDAKRQLFSWLSAQGGWQPPVELAQAWAANGPVKSGELYPLVLAVCRAMMNQAG